MSKIQYGSSIWSAGEDNYQRDSVVQWYGYVLLHKQKCANRNVSLTDTLYMNKHLFQASFPN